MTLISISTALFSTVWRCLTINVEWIRQWDYLITTMTGISASAALFSKIWMYFTINNDWNWKWSYIITSLIGLSDRTALYSKVCRWTVLCWKKKWQNIHATALASWIGATPAVLRWGASWLFETIVDILQWRTEVNNTSNTRSPRKRLRIQNFRTTAIWRSLNRRRLRNQCWNWVTQGWTNPKRLFNRSWWKQLVLSWCEPPLEISPVMSRLLIAERH